MARNAIPVVDTNPYAKPYLETESQQVLRLILKSDLVAGIG